MKKAPSKTAPTPAPREITLAHLSDTAVHPLLAQVAMLDDAIEWLRETRDTDPDDLAEKQRECDALRESIKINGVLEPLKAVLKDGTWLVCDGRHRRAYALEASLEVVPIIEIAEKDARAVILRENALRRSQTKGQIAWLAVCVNPEVVESRQGPANSDSVGITRSQLAAENGVSADLIDQACKLYKLVAKSKKGRAAVEAQIAAGCGLGAVIAGIAGEAALPTDESGKPKRPESSLTGLTKTLGTFKTQIAAFAKWKAEQRDIAVTAAAALLKDNAAAREFWTAALEQAEQS